MVADSATVPLPHIFKEKRKYFECFFDISNDKLTAASHAYVDCIGHEGCYYVSSSLNQVVRMLCCQKYLYDS